MVLQGRPVLPGWHGECGGRVSSTGNGGAGAGLRCSLPLRVFVEQPALGAAVPVCLLAPFMLQLKLNPLCRVAAIASAGQALLDSAVPVHLVTPLDVAVEPEPLMYPYRTCRASCAGFCSACSPSSAWARPSASSPTPPPWRSSAGSGTPTSSCTSSSTALPCWCGYSASSCRWCSATGSCCGEWWDTRQRGAGELHTSARVGCIHGKALQMCRSPGVLRLVMHLLYKS